MRRAGQGIAHEWFGQDQRQQLLERAAALALREDVWFGLAGFCEANEKKSSSGRASVDTRWLRALWIDLDYKNYADAQAGADHLTAYIESLGLEWSDVVLSGGGMHAYLMLDQDLPVAQWLPLAEAFQKHWQAFGVTADVLSADAARVLRLPGTANFKYDPPALVGVWGEPGPSYDYERLRSLFKPVARSSAYDKLLAASAPLNEAVEYPPSDTKLVARHCQQFKAAATTGGAGRAEPLWYADLGVAVFTTGGTRAAIMVSKAHPDYSESTTLKKAEQRKDAAGPTTCDYYERVNPVGCAGCPHKGKVKTPLQLGYPVPEAGGVVQVVEPVPVVMEDGSVVEVQETIEYDVEIPGFARYNRDENRMYLCGKAEQGDDDPDVDDAEDAPKYQWTPVINGFLTLSRRVQDHEADTTFVEFVVKNGSSPVRTHLVSSGCLFGPKELAKALLEIGVPFIKMNITNYKLVHEYVQKKHAELGKLMPEKIITQLGWQDDGSFLTGHETIANGTRRVSSNCALGESLNNQAATLKPLGTLDGWKQAAEVYNTPERMMSQFILMAGAVGVLLPMTQTKGLTVCLYSPESGSGKTTVSRGAISWFTNPTEAMMTTDATIRAPAIRLRDFQNFGVLIDEVTLAATSKGSSARLDLATLSDLAYGMPTGVTRTGATSSGNMRPTATTGAQPLFLTSNASMRDSIVSRMADNEGQSVRLIELEYQKHELSHDEAAILYNGFNTNCCQAGPVFVQVVQANKEKVAQAVALEVNRFTKETLDDTGRIRSSERFYRDFCACLVVATRIANSLGLVKFDADAVRAYCFEVIAGQRKEVSIGLVKPIELLVEFLNQNVTGIVSVVGDGVFDAIHNRDSLKLDKIVGRVQDRKQLFIKKAALQEYCAAKGASHRKVMAGLETSGVMVADSKRLLGQLVRAHTGVLFKAYAFDLSHEALEGLEYGGVSAPGKLNAGKATHLQVVKP